MKALDSIWEISAEGKPAGKALCAVVGWAARGDRSGLGPAPKAMAAPDRLSGLTAECSHEDSLEQLQEAKREEPIHKHGGRGTMRSRYQFDTGVDTGRKDTALMRAEPRWPGRLRLRLLRPCSSPLSPRSRSTRIRRTCRSCRRRVPVPRSTTGARR